jgi:hypothetical protein
MTSASDEFNDPEQSFRRGYVQGACAVFDVVEKELSLAQRSYFQQWLRDLRQWRTDNMRGKTGRKKIAPFITADIAPPKFINHE